MRTNDRAAQIDSRLIRDALDRAFRDGLSVIEVLESALSTPTYDLLAAVGDYFHYPVLDMTALDQLRPAFDLLSLHEAAKKRCAVLRDTQDKLVGAFSDPSDFSLLSWAEGRCGHRIEWHLVRPADLHALLSRHEAGVHALDSSIDTGEISSPVEHTDEITLQTIGSNVSPIVRIVNSMIYDAMKAGASDIHIEARASGMAIKYRIDGALSVAGEIAGATTSEQVISRIKVLAELDIAERRVPQDGRFKAYVLGRDVDFRVSIMPSVFAEDAVIRILDKETLTSNVTRLSLDVLGFDADALAVIRHLSSEPYGMLLVTGPTGSGKTTTLYAALSEINSGEDKIVTIEDPVEYMLPGVLQIPVNEKKGLTFARGLRSVLRHDPDKIMVGEIRDSETAEIAVQSALTGHLVFTTVHANNVFDVIGRFVHMGVDPYSFVSALNGIVAQRLVRRICRNCAQPAHPSPELLAASAISPSEALSYQFMEGKGCGQCRGSGYRGRKAIAEYMIINDELRELIIARTSIRGLKEAAARAGTRPLRQVALAAVLAGETSLQEINRITFT